MKHKLAFAALLAVLASIAACSHEKTPGSAAQQATEGPFVPPKARHGHHVAAGRLPPPARTMDNPYQSDAQFIASGKQLFITMHCDGCHGAGAIGAVGPSLADGRWRYGGSSAEIFESIFAGRTNGMPAYGGVLPKEAIWQLVTYLEALTPDEDPATVEFPR